MNIKDVARLSGVSISTISRVINNSAYVSPEIKERVEKVLTETGYRPNSLAKELLRNKTDTIGVMLPRIDLSTFAQTIDGISSTLTESGYNILLANTRDSQEEELRYLTLFYEKRVDGILYFATDINERHLQALSKLRIPVVIVGQSGSYLNCPAVRLDNFGAARAMVNYLVSIGHRRIGFIGVSDHDHDIGTLRREGYLAALRDNGIPADPELMWIGDFEYPSGERGARRLMELPGERPTAVFCVTDRLSISTSGWLNRNGYRVPEDVSVACIDDPGLLSFCHPSVTTMSFDYMAAGSLAAKMIIEYIEGRVPEPSEILLPYTIQIRDSTKPLEGAII